MLYFLDCEASSLRPGGFPIEIAWVAEDGVGEAHMIRPAPGWENWSSSAEAVHGLTREHLAVHGRPHLEVARRAARVLGDPRAVVASDAPAYDGRWLNMLLAAAGLPPVPVVDSRLLHLEVARHPFLARLPSEGALGFEGTRRALLAAASAIVGEARASERARLRGRCRAIPNAEALLWTHRDVHARVALLLQG
jgi:hypothetical protein